MTGDFPGVPVVKNPPSNAGDMGSIPGWGTKIPHAAGQLSPRAANYRALTLWNPCATTGEKPTRCNEEPTSHKKKIPHATTKTQCSQK